MNDLVWVALITALAAVVPQVLTWKQNQKRDQWERGYRQRELEGLEVERIARLASAERAEQTAIMGAELQHESAAIEQRRDLLTSLVGAIGDYQRFIPGVDKRNVAHSLVLTRCTEALFAAEHYTRSSVEDVAELFSKGQPTDEAASRVRSQLVRAVQNMLDPLTMQSGNTAITIVER